MLFCHLNRLSESGFVHSESGLWTGSTAVLKRSDSKEQFVYESTINQLQHSALYVTQKLHAIVNLEFTKNWHFIIPRAVPHTRANYRAKPIFTGHRFEGHDGLKSCQICRKANDSLTIAKKVEWFKTNKATAMCPAPSPSSRAMQECNVNICTTN